MLNLTGYRETETLYTGTRTFVYRATRRSDDQSVIIKVLRNPHPTFNELVQFRNQYVITQNLESPYIVKPLALERYNNGYALVMPDEGAVALTNNWQASERALSELLRIAIQLAESLHILAGQHIIHKDIKPANILIHPETGQVQLIDFSIASLLSKEQQQLVNPKKLEGTLAYISPEQTGRMNRGIDYRSDFYALGVTLYELLTGMLPFNLSDPLELIHCHIAQTPMPPEEILNAQGQLHSKTLSVIIMKLMAKNTEDRYQNALGLKHDLEQCLQSLEATGAIVNFEVGKRDICDRFNIPEKLYGREAEVQSLLDSFERVANGTSEMMLIAGFSGIGKTAIINEVHKPIVRQRGYFIKGKFDQFNRNIPFSAFVQAFRDLMGQLLSESDTELAYWRAKILEAVRENGQILIDVIPELERVIGQQPLAPELSGTAAQNRFNRLFEQFIAVFTTPEHPLVMFLDDLQWADSASLNLMKVLMGDSKAGYLMVLGAYRDNEVFLAHPLILILEELEEKKAEISIVTLASLPISNINQLIAEMLNCPSDLAKPLTNFVYQKTQGNPFFTIQFLKGLYEDQLIVFNSDLGYWQCDLMQVQDAALTDDVVEFMAGRLLKLTQATQDMLKLAACIGNQFDLETLAIVCEDSVETVATELWGALREGLILPITEAYKFFQAKNKDEEYINDVVVGYRFLHDRVQQAAYSLIPDSDKKSTHRKIGQRLLVQSQSTNAEEMIFAIVEQLNIGHELIDEQDEKLNLANLNLKAGKKAKVSTAYTAAIDYLKTALHLLPPNSWDSHYLLTLIIYVELLESNYLSTNFDLIEEISPTILSKTKTLLDSIKVYEIKIRAWIGRGDQHQALEIGLDVLKLLGISLRETQPDRVADIPALVNAPEMSAPHQLAAMKIMEFIITPAWAVSAEFFKKITFTMVDLSLEYGNCASSAFGYVWYGTLLCEALGDIDAGYEFGQLSVALLDHFYVEELRSKVLVLYASCIGFWKEHVRNFLSTHLDGLQSGLDTGDLEFASYGAAEYSQYLFLIGLPLDRVKNESQQKLAIIQHLKQDFHVDYLAPWLQGTLNLLGECDTQDQLAGSIYFEEKRLPILVQQKQLTLVFVAYFVKSFLSYVFGNPLKATEEGKIAREHSAGVAGTLFIPAELFYSSLAQIACFAQWSQEDSETIREEIVDSLEKLQHWAKYAPMNYQHKCDLIEAELARQDQHFVQAIKFYDRAIAGAKENEYIQEEALANELFAKFYLDWGRQKEAAVYMQEAYYCYARWGAKAKTDHLEANYPELLTPILQKQRVEFNAIDNLTSLTQTLTASLQSSTQSSTSISDTLDFAAILYTAQKLSRTIKLEQLLGDIIQIILTNAGAQKMALFTLNESQWQLQVSAEQAENGNIVTQTSAQPLNNESSVPTRLIQYVKNTREPILISEAKTEISGILEGYLLKHQPQSVFCVPLLNQGNLVAIAYLEHPTTKGVFTRNRQTIIAFLCAQAAVALQNAQLYQQAQQSQAKAEQSQAEAEQAFLELQQAQIQLVQSEKMSALGNLVAGVAHEINNPVGFLKGNIQPAQEYVQDLFGLIDFLLQECPKDVPHIQDEVEEVDLDFVRKDLPDLINSMNSGVDRIRNISDSLRTFSRKDQEYKTAFNIQDGIESTLLILTHRTKANEQRPAVQILKNYGELPDVQCFPGQLNQVFMNILANAIDAFDEINQGKIYQEIEARPNQITIATSVKDEHVQIQIKDNGCGMKPEIVERIFEQGFTTKGVGKGTGLGMAIAHQIITDKHGGTITCTSSLSQGTTFTIALPLARD